MLPPIYIDLGHGQPPLINLLYGTVLSLPKNTTSIKFLNQILVPTNANSDSIGTLECQQIHAQFFVGDLVLHFEVQPKPGATRSERYYQFDGTPSG